jgi:hypothetical protein
LKVKNQLVETIEKFNFSDTGSETPKKRGRKKKAADKVVES